MLPHEELKKELGDLRLAIVSLKKLAQEAPTHTPHAASYNIQFPDQLRIAVKMLEDLVTKTEKRWNDFVTSRQYASMRFMEVLDTFQQLLTQFKSELDPVMRDLHLAGLDPSSIQKWLLLYGPRVRLKILAEIAKVLKVALFMARWAFSNVTKDTAKIRIKFRGSLVRGIKTYHKGSLESAKRFDENKFDCDAYIEVPDELWEQMKKAGVQRYEYETEESGQRKMLTTTTTVRAYEPLSYLVSKECTQWLTVFALLKKVEQMVRVKLAKIKGYDVEITEEGPVADFEFYLRPASNSVDLYKLGNPYMKGQISGLGEGFEFLEKTLTERLDDEFDKKKDEIALLKTYVDQYGPKSMVMPEFQVVVTEHGWYFEDDDLFQDWTHSASQPEKGITFLKTGEIKSKL